MAYKSFKSKWPVTGDKPIITILTNGLICFNQACYERFVLPAGFKYVKLYYDPEMKKMAFEPVHKKIGERVFPINLIKPGLFAVVRAKTFLDYYDVKYAGHIRSYPVYETIITDPDSGYKLTWSAAKRKIIEIRLDEYLLTGEEEHE